MKTAGMTQVGTFAVDSGQFMIIDPCYVWDDDFKYGGEPTGKPYDSACRITLDKNFGQLEGGFVSSTLHGDGEYPVYAELDDRGRVVSITISFDWEVDEDEDEDEDDDFYNDDDEEDE